MNGRMIWCGVALATVSFLSPATEFPLEFKTLTAQESMDFPGGGGRSGVLTTLKPTGISKEPPPVSKHPLYGQLDRSTNGFLFRLDESKGDGKGYDRLILDLNRNGDLTDDAAVSLVEQPESASRASGSDRTETLLFGPIPASANSIISGQRPIYYARVFHYKLPSGLRQAGSSAYLGFVQLRAGWYLEATVELDGVKQRIGIVDGDSNLRLGDPSSPVTTRDGKEWYFQNRDSFLKEVGGAGKLERSATAFTSAPFGPILYLGAKPWKVTLAADCKSLALEPWPEPLAELALQPHGEQVHSVEVAWESTPGQWQLLAPGIEKAKVKVPPGNYRLIDCELEVKPAACQTLTVMGEKSTISEPVKASVDASAPFKCGAPLEINVGSARGGSRAGSADSESRPFWRRLDGLFTGSEPMEQVIQASLIGAGGEMYRIFMLEDRNGRREPPSPTFTITAAGKEVESGKLEYG